MSKPEEPCPDDMQPAWPELLDFDYAAAEREGWAIVQTDPRGDGSPMVVIAHLETGEALANGIRSDGDARRHVADRAKAGSALHKQALSLIDRYERFVITALHGSTAS